MRGRNKPDFLNGVPELLVIELLSVRAMYGCELVRAIAEETAGEIAEAAAKRMRPRAARRARLAVLALPLVLMLGACQSDRSIRIVGEGVPVRAEDGYELTVFRCREDRRGEEPSALLFYVQGSDAVSVRGSLEQLAGACAMGAEVVLLERRGVNTAGEVDVEEFRRHSSKSRRVEDQLLVVERCTRLLGKGLPVILMGGSEGADVAAAVAARSNLVTQLILVGGGCGWSQAEELEHLLRTRGEVVGIGSPAVLEQTFAKIREEPDSLAIWAGHPYRRWSSFLWSPPREDLLTVDVPILLAHGAADASVPVESARVLVEAFEEAGKGNLSYFEYEGADHRLIEVSTGRSLFPRLELDILRWLEQQGVLPAEDADRYARRVREARPEVFGGP